jgi:hypothetical protein
MAATGSSRIEAPMAYVTNPTIFATIAYALHGSDRVSASTLSPHPLLHHCGAPAVAHNVRVSPQYDVTRVG